MLQKLTHRALEHFAEINSVEIQNKEVLDTIRNLNMNGEYVIFAPNHIKPASEAKQGMAFAEDYPVLQKILKEHGIKKVGPVMRGDMDKVINERNEQGELVHPEDMSTLSIFKAKVRRIAYTTHRKIFSILLKKGLNAETVYLNKYEKELRKQLNQDAKTTISAAVMQKNVSMFPFGNWFESGAQQFDEKTALPDDNFFSSEAHGHAEQTRAEAIHEGMFDLSSTAQAKIIPTYISVEHGAWKIAFGEPISPPENETQHLSKAKEWLASMRELKRLSQ